MTDRAETEYEIRVRRAKLGYVSALSWRVSTTRCGRGGAQQSVGRLKVRGVVETGEKPV